MDVGGGTLRRNFTADIASVGSVCILGVSDCSTPFGSLEVTLILTNATTGSSAVPAPVVDTEPIVGSEKGFLPCTMA